MGGSGLWGREPCGDRVRLGWDGKLRVGWWGGLPACVPFPRCLPPPSHLQGALIRAETAKGEKTVLTNKLLAVYEQVKAELE